MEAGSCDIPSKHRIKTIAVVVKAGTIILKELVNL